MRIQVTFKQQNPQFDREYAKIYHGGRESEGNYKDLWSTRLDLTSEIEKIAITEKGDLKLPLQSGGTITIPNMTILECIQNNDVIATFAVSKSLISKTHKAYNEKYDITRYYFYFEPREDFVRISNSVFVLEKDLPKELQDS